METQIFQQEIQEILDRQIAARAALAALPEDTPEAIRKNLLHTVEKVDAAVVTLNEQIIAYDDNRISVGSFRTALRKLNDSVKPYDYDAEKDKASRQRQANASWLIVFVVVAGAMILALGSGTGSRSGRSSPRQENSQASYKFTVSVRDGSAFTKTAAQNIACQQAGFAGAVLEDIECSPDPFGSCARAEITLACTRSQAAHQQNIRTLRAFAETLR